MVFPFLNSHGVLGLNARNLLYIKPWNPKKAVAFADDKMKTKAFLSARGIPAARLFARIENRLQLRQFDFSALPERCVLKPNYGFGGEGIIILKGRKNGEFLEQGKQPISEKRLREHIEDIFDGTYSVNGLPDTAFFEQLLEPDECFAPFRPAGLPDIRIVVFNLVPVMAMLRIPTAESGGKANVHLGGIGIGIDIAKGTTTHAAQYHRMLKELPHGFPVAGMQIPRWEEMLLISSRIQQITNIGYLAVDLTLDREMGPVLLEVNARAGLMVQVANLAPLQSRLERVQGLKVSSPEKGVRMAQDLFGEKISNRRDTASEDRTILGHRETIEILGDGFTVEEPGALAPEQEHTVFSQDLVTELLARGALEATKGAPGTYRAKLTIGERKIQTALRQGTIVVPGVRILIGRRDLAGFLIDPSRKPSITPQAVVRQDLRAVDRLLAGIDKDISMLRELRPINLEEELPRLQSDRLRNPVFLLRESTVDLGEAEENLRKIETDDSPLGILLKKKRRELLLKVELLKARGNPEKFTTASLALYGAPSAALIGFAASYLRDAPPKEVTEEALLSAKQTAKEFERVVASYGLHDWTVIVKPAMVSDCAVGGKRIFIREGARFTRQHIDCLVAHEIETHAFTTENGSVQPYELFRRGFANYLDTQEGLAIYNQMRVVPPGHEKRLAHAKNVLGIAYAMEHSFAELRRYLVSELGFSEEKALMKAIDFKRGIGRTAESGAFTRGLVYFRGYRAIEQFVREKGDLKRLYVGKIAIEDLSIIDRIEGLKPPLILPLWLRSAPPARKKRAPKPSK